ncbi:Solute carrier family 22 member 15 [Gossypium arboreum]|uniref:Solute carrier family 22 member 15 n=1 Tax=Gossypium arboreum TaxID=29729 RepID=A0A0B0PAM9_GOSAR|nr:Solute carrier family 22 member 15 [Gossypium arboreum]
MHIPVPSRNGFIYILILGIPNEPLRIKISDTRETLYIRCHISIIKPANTSCQSQCSNTMLLTQAVK